MFSFFFGLLSCVWRWPAFSILLHIKENPQTKCLESLSSRSQIDWRFDNFAFGFARKHSLLQDAIDRIPAGTKYEHYHRRQKVGERVSRDEGIGVEMDELMQRLLLGREIGDYKVDDERDGRQSTEQAKPE